MKQSALLLGLHCHQPVDNFHHVVDEAIEKSYKPFFEIAYKYEDFKFSLHYSGWLLEYIKNNDPILFTLMKELSKRGQIEFLTGGYYEPILASISSDDRIAQITKLNNFLEENFGQTPKGLWLTERVWDSVLIKDLAKCGVEYVVVDDYHFIAAGFDKEDLKGYFLTEDEGISLKIFPINKELRYTIPFENPSKVCNYLESIADTPTSAGVIFDDGEKFGIWPKTYEWVYEKKWLEKFIQEIEQSKIIKPMLYKEYIQQNKPISLAYLPITSYIEMGEWALKAKDNLLLKKIENSLSHTFGEDSVEKFVKGTIWKNFLIKYIEANRIHKRYLALSNSKIDNQNYLESLYKAQTNDVLWHGVFGGIYLPNLRDNAWRFIIECENIKYQDQSHTEIKDNNLDGYEEIKFISKNLITVFDTKAGGQLTEFDIRDRSFNLQNTMSRYFESYHQSVMSEKEEITDPADIEEQITQDAIASIHDIDENMHQYKEMLHHDWHTKNSFIDHITDSTLSLDTFLASSFNEYGDFANQPFNLVETKEQKCTLKRDGGIYIEEQKHQTTITKTYETKEDEISFEIKIDTNINDGYFYLLEHNFHFANLKDIMINSQSFATNQMIKQEGLKEALEIKDSNILIFNDPYTQKEITITLSENCTIYLAPINTLSKSEAGFDVTNQGLSIGLKFKLQTAHPISGSIVVG